MPNHTQLVENWLRHNNGDAHTSAFECVFYTDSGILGQVEGECGPYHFLNPVVSPYRRGVGRVLPAIVLRCYYKREPQAASHREVPNNSLYHGGWIIEEIAAISSLFMGIRILASEITREFHNLELNPTGQPVGYNHKSPPTLTIHASSTILPCAYSPTVNLSALHDAEKVLSLDSDQEIAFIRAARLYQDALWIAESDPNMAWLLLVSAIEAVAGCNRIASATNRELFQQGYPDLCERLKSEGHAECIDWLSEHFAPLTKATQTFINFSLEFLPPAPAERPLEFMRIDWTSGFWKSAFKKIYAYRSKALHEGTPFPLPMMDPPYLHNNCAVPAEKGTTSLGVRVGNASWEAADLPINLNLFTQVTRQLILKWLDRIYHSRSAGAL